jgi:hypothetical protein
LLKVALSTLILTPFTSALFFSVLVQFIFICLQRLEFLVTHDHDGPSEVKKICDWTNKSHTISCWSWLCTILEASSNMVHLLWSTPSFNFCLIRLNTPFPFSLTPHSQMNRNLVGSIDGKSSIKIANFVPIH